MTFDLTTIAVFVIMAALMAILPARWRGWALLILSAATAFVLQPRLDILWLDFAFPVLTVGLTVIGWAITRPPQAEPLTAPHNRIALILLAVTVVGLSFFRYVEPAYRLTPSRPPEPLLVIGWVIVMSVLLSGVAFSVRRRPPLTISIALFALIVLFIILKTEPLATTVAGVLRAQTGRDPMLATPLDLNWLGFSYIAFRLIHTLRDRQTGILPALTLREYVTYVMFPTSLVAGPIDRAERFVDDLRARHPLTASRVTVGLTRIMAGVTKKFIIADTLAQGMSLNSINALQADSPVGFWLLLYSYGLRLFFDFSGYSDIAIGCGILFGITLPENFDRPYLKTNITAFWQSWHITLSNWVRFYVFSPLSRGLLRRQPRPSSTVIVLISQLATMIIIGLWHGVTVNFFIWGVWHGVGLWLHKQFSDRTRKRYNRLKQSPVKLRIWQFTAWALTFHFVMLGWVWFALPDVATAFHVFGGLFGVG